MFGAGLNFDNYSYSFGADPLQSQSNSNSSCIDLKDDHASKYNGHEDIDPSPFISRVDNTDDPEIYSDIGMVEAIEESLTVNTTVLKRQHNLSSIIKQSGYKSVRILGDGECFYRSAAIFFFSDENQYILLRQLTARWCLLNFTLLHQYQYLPGNEILLNELTQYHTASIAFDAIKTLKRYAEPLDIICLSNALNQTIRVATMEAILRKSIVEFNMIGIPFNWTNRDGMVTVTHHLRNVQFVNNFNSLDLLFLNGNHYEILTNEQSVYKRCSESSTAAKHTKRATMRQSKFRSRSSSVIDQISINDQNKITATSISSNCKRLKSPKAVKTASNINIEARSRPNQYPAGRSRVYSTGTHKESNYNNMEHEINQESSYLYDISNFNEYLNKCSNLLICLSCGQQLPSTDMTETIYDLTSNIHI